MLQKQRIINEFQKLVSMDSESFCERQIADYLKEKLEAFGFTVSEDDAGEVLTEQGLNLAEKENLPYTGNLYAFLPGNCEGEPILLAAHMDTVKPGQGKQAILHADGKITSDGSTVLGADDLSGVVSILEALQVIHEEQLPHPDIEILFSVAEELFSLGSRVFDYSQIRAKQAYVFDLSGPVGTAALAAPTILSLDICVNGKDAHAGFAPETGIHSIAIAATAIAEIQNDRINDTTTVNIGTIHGGDGKNIVPKQCVISGEVRSMDHETALAQAENIRKIFEEKADAYGGTTEMKVTEEVHAYRVALDNPVVQRFHRACQAAGLSEQLVDTYGGSDNNNFALHGITGIVPACAMENVHSCQEYTCVDELERSARLVLELILA